MAGHTKSSQEILDQFWNDSIATSNITKASAVLPPNAYSQLVGSQVPRGATAAEPVGASYETAKKECEKKVAQIVKECQMVNLKYSDPYFDLENKNFCLFPLAPKPSSTDLDKPGTSYDITQNGGPVGNLVIFGPQQTSGLTGVYPASVKRVGDIFDNPQFFVDGASSKDIRQGREGDCWFLSALSTLCNLEPTEHLINRVCVAQDQDVGVYGFLFYRDGEWTSVIIDDKLYLREPDFEFADSATRSTWEENRIRVNSEEEYRKEFQSNSRSLYYAQSAHPDETWVPLIEKAFAKAHGDYGAISGGSVGEGVEDLTGGVSTTIIPTNILSKERFWNECVLQVNKDFLIGCGTANWDDTNGLGRDGIHGGHAYSVLRAVNYGKERLMLLKNPWGEREWNGPWSDGSSQWTPESIKALDHTFGDDGIFWIRYEDVLRKYDVIWRTRLFSPEWRVTQQWTSLAIPWAGEYQDTKFEVTITKATPTVIVLSKLDDRYFQGLTGQYDFEISFRVHKAGEEDYLMRSFTGECWDRSTNCELALEPGTYEVCLKITATRDDGAAKVEDVVKDNWLDRREKLLLVGQSYDLAHAKAQVTEEEKPTSPVKETSAVLASTEAAKAEVATTRGPDKEARVSDTIEPKGAAPYEDDDVNAPAPAPAIGDKEADEKGDDKPDAPWSAVGVVGLRVYCKDDEATIKVIRPKPAAAAEAKLDVDDPARDASKGAEAKEKEKEKEEDDEKKDDEKKDDEKKDDEKKDDEKKDDEKKDDEKKDDEKKDDEKKDDIKKEYDDKVKKESEEKKEEAKDEKRDVKEQ